MSLLQLNPTIPVLCKGHGYGEAFIISDVSIDVNPIYHVRFDGGIVKHFYSDDIRIVGNPMNGKGWDVKEFEDKDVVHKIPAGAKRNTDFLKDTKQIKKYILMCNDIKYPYLATTLSHRTSEIRNARIFYSFVKAQVYADSFSKVDPDITYLVHDFPNN